jgi:hypothetical protein
MSEHNEEDVLDQVLSGSGERGMQASGVGGSLSSQAPIASLELPASGDQQEQQQQQSRAFSTTDDAADPSRSEARHRPDQRAKIQAKAGSAAQEQCCTQCPVKH